MDRAHLQFQFLVHRADPGRLGHTRHQVCQLLSGAGNLAGKTQDLLRGNAVTLPLEQGRIAANSTERRAEFMRGGHEELIFELIQALLFRVGFLYLFEKLRIAECTGCL